MMTPPEKQEYLNKLTVLCCIVGFRKSDGKLDGCICLDAESMELEKKKFEEHKIFEIKK